MTRFFLHTLTGASKLERVLVSPDQTYMPRKRRSAVKATRRWCDVPKRGFKLCMLRVLLDPVNVNRAVLMRVFGGDRCENEPGADHQSRQAQRLTQAERRRREFEQHGVRSRRHPHTLQ